jgi:hypothetical protein
MALTIGGPALTVLLPVGLVWLVATIWYVVQVAGVAHRPVCTRPGRDPRTDDRFGDTLAAGILAGEAAQEVVQRAYCPPGADGIK